MTAQSIGWGKVILLGEHAVVYGYPALAAALDRGVIVAPVPTTKGMRIDIPAWGIAIKADDDHLVARSLCAVADALEIGRPSVSLVGDAQIPYGAGLGSSAALAVALARALLAHARRPPTAGRRAPSAIDPATLAHAATASERIVHGRPSGVDVALAIAGGIGVFRRSTGLIPLTQHLSLRVLVGPSGEPRSTGAMVARVADAVGATEGGERDEPPRSSDERLRELGALTDAGTTALLANDLVALGAAFDRAHALLGDLGVSTPLLDELCASARAAGAHGAKLTGAGGGGSMIAIAPRDREAAILAAWRARGVNGFATTVSVR